jgi:hypothetical protein
MDPDGKSNEVSRAIRIVGRNREYLDSRIDSYNDYATVPLAHPPSPAMSVQWLRLPSENTQILVACRARGLEILPGDNFYWSPSCGDSRYVRLALMRDPSYFARGLDILVDVLGNFCRPENSFERD